VSESSEKVLAVTGAQNVSESSALCASNNDTLLLSKQKGCDENGKHYTLAVAMDLAYERRGMIYIVGAGPGDPELVSVKGKRLLQAADLILYAGSLVPEQLTHYAKEGCVVRNSAQMDLEEQFDTMKTTYDKGGLVVRLHTGDPCIYGAIQEQMNFFDQHKMPYDIVPGISSFQAAAARLKSQFTIPERIQTIILTRGEGRTPMPPKEKLSELAKFQSTICLFLSVSLIDEMQRQLLEGYPPETPVAICYKLTWKEEKIWRGQLKDLAKIVKENKLKLTVMIVVGDAIDNRDNRSKLYDRKFTHLFRSGKDD
jgi:precorrin-4 C11-methyltransferase